MSIQSTRWFELSGRELKVLLIVAVVALLALSGERLYTEVTSGPEVKVEGGMEEPLRPVRIDINSAEPYELELVNGIGATTAENIVNYRAESGPFSSLEELQKVNGIGPKTLDDLRPYLMCRSPSSCSDGDEDGRQERLSGPCEEGADK
ncbi:MAG: ComEA family DNA-binding protein [Planctomycetota bacterium]